MGNCHQYNPSVATASPTDFSSFVRSSSRSSGRFITPLRSRMTSATGSGQSSVSPLQPSQGTWSSTTKCSREMPLSSGSPSSTAFNNVGGVEADDFIDSFLDVPRITHIVSGSAVEAEMAKISQVLSDVMLDWAKRVDALKRLRSVVLAGGDIYKEFYASLRFTDVSLQISVKDLRSQVVREACVTLAFFAQQLGPKFERTAEVLLPHLISLIPNSTKIISTCGIVTIRFILQNTHSSKLIPILVNHLRESRSKDVRRYCCEFVKHILFVWPKEPLEKYASLLQEAIKRGITDADPEARALSRQAYWQLNHVFPGAGENLLNQLDPANVRMLQEVRQPGSAMPQRSLPESPRGTPSRDSSCTRPPSRLRKPTGHSESENEPLQPSGAPPRSSSAIDTEAARRARARIAPPSGKTVDHSSGLATPLRSRRALITPSTTASRGTSPASALRKPGVSRSVATSRDSSPDKRTFSGLPVRRAPSVSSTPVATRKNSTGYRSEDEGDTGSQLGSQTSLSGNGSCYDVPEILSLLGNPNWSSRKEGLLGLRSHLRSGGRLYPADVDNVRLLLTRMMSDPTTKVFSLFLDTLYDFLNAHKLDLGSWLYTLLTRLFNKMSVELLPTVQAKLDRCFDLIRASFAAENQFQQLLKFVNDSLQTPNLKVKVAFLNYLVTLITSNMGPNDFKNTSAVRIGVTKLVNWTLDGKSTELRRASQSVIIALHHLNSGEFTAMLALMDEYLRDTALKTISGPTRREGRGESSRQTSAANSRQASSSDLRKVPSSASSPQSSNDENLNPHDFYASLKQTTDAIDKLNTFLNVDHSSDDEGRRNGGSEDSGFSRTSLNNIPAAVELEHSSQDGELDLPAESPQNKDILSLLWNLQCQAESGDTKTWSGPDGDSAVYILQEAMEHEAPSVLSAAMQCCTNLARAKAACIERILPSILNLCHNERQEVISEAHQCLKEITSQLPLDKVLEALAVPLLSENQPMNTRAVSFLLRLVQETPTQKVRESLPSILTPVVQGFSDSQEPNVRKDCMLIIVDVQSRTSTEAVTPFIRNLSPNKIKLLNLYLHRK
ncbi:hypothetical protein RvY_01005-2 [Ramazzottius varieornatus]|uniref:TOG domain-containing protein n=1 Tax=Ramazzottius varieornatus TaxID=947166 RepID=A0A1D1UQ38_RAMVA|nr:hypothetical protein RvY_01005-2 [Ramazzottius varieornatus]